jgi:arsenate reductase-like glutaredoxin family protein
MEYFLFTYPNCSKCEEIKKYLGGANLEGQECNLVLKESKLRIREFLGCLKRDDKGAIIIPTLVLRENGEVVTVLNNSKELEDWLRSKA